MSDWLEFRCVSHSPYIGSESIHEIWAYDKMKDLLSRRDEFNKIFESVFPWEYQPDDVREGIAARFFASHPKCDIEIWDEFNRGPYPLEPEKPRPTHIGELGTILKTETIDGEFIAQIKLNDHGIRKLRLYGVID